jgi:hypothetical protein
LAVCWCELITAGSVPSSLEDIGTNALAYWTARESIEIRPESSLARIGSPTLFNCSGDAHVHPDPLPPPRIFLLQTIASSTFAECANVIDGDFHDESSFRGIGERGFCGLRPLVAIALPQSVDSIGKYGSLHSADARQCAGSRNDRAEMRRNAEPMVRDIEGNKLAVLRRIVVRWGEGVCGDPQEHLIVGERRITLTG